ncbi:MAG: hypothetical protein H6752_04555 [Candidatus Omnitrophica bacterium]|nr:hypothetical protein [Candidatus Omnitrophota bacterium]
MPPIQRFCVQAISLCLAFVCLGMTSPALAAPDVLSFDRDPGWERYGKNADDLPSRTMHQDFGWRPSNHAGGESPGEIGGVISRSLTRACYWVEIPTQTLETKLTLSGRVANVHTDNNCAMQFGFFNKDSEGWRTPNSLVFRLSGENKERRGQYSWALADYCTQKWRAGGLGAFDGRYQTTDTPPIKSDGKPHDFIVAYDPKGASGVGEISIAIDGKEWKTELLEGHKEEGAVFNRFGLMNIQVSGNSMEVYLDDIRMNGKLLDFSDDPHWEGINNQGDIEEGVARPWNVMDWEETNRAGGDPGEMSVMMWRDEAPAYFATPISGLTLDDPIHAEGRLAFSGAGSDSGVYIGFFDSETKRGKETPDHVVRQSNILAVMLEGPSRVGHYFRAAYGASSGANGHNDSGPIIQPDGEPRHWSLDYDPKANDGVGSITVRLDEEEVVLDLNPEARKQGATFDRFGFFNMQSGGHYVKVSIDDVRFSGMKD